MKATVDAGAPNGGHGKRHKFENASLNMQLETHWLNELITAIANGYWE